MQLIADVRDAEISTRLRMEREPCKCSRTSQCRHGVTARTQHPNRLRSIPIFLPRPRRAGFSLPLPAIAGAIGLVVVIAIGGWFAMSGSSEPPREPQADSSDL